MTLKLTKKLPDILLESLFIVVALLGALAIDEWREESEKVELAMRAQAAVVKEIKDNHQQLLEKLPVHQKMLQELTDKVAIFDKTSEVPSGFNFSYSMAILTSAAWDSARMTQSAQFMSFDKVSEFSKIYSFQELYIENQYKLIDLIMQIGDLEEEQFPKFAKGFNHRLQLLIEVNQMLSEAYAKVEN